jgi:hypothetical protein
MDIAALRSALAGTLEPLSVNAYSYAPDAPISPAAFIYPEAFQYHPTFDAGFDISFVVRFLVASTNTQAGQNQLDDLISQDGTKSAVAALETDQTLGGLCTSLEVTDLRNYGVVSLTESGTRYLSAELLVSILG